VSQAAFDLDLDDGGSPTYSVGELAEAINGTLRSKFYDGVWVRGEIQGYNERGPHAYFRVVEETDTGKAALNVQFFANARARLRPILAKHRLNLSDGLKVRIFGHLDYYAPSGQLGLKMSGIDPRFTLGDLALQRDDVVRRLVANGLFDANRGLRVPLAPLRVGVVASLDSAAWADFHHELARSGLGFQLRVIDVRVQGEWAVTEVTRALRTLTRHDDLDVVTLIRGGGSRTELATFDAEPIALAIAASALPVFTGLGHEIDRSVADEVAHSALKTPTACAAALVEAVGRFCERTELVWTAIERHTSTALNDATARLEQRRSSAHQRTTVAVQRAAERLADRVAALRTAGERNAVRAERHLLDATASVARTPRMLDHEVRHLDSVAQRVRLLDPVHTMARGWSITRGPDGRAVRSAAELRPGEQIVTTFAAGSARSTVEETTT
jgi:exodeoxyribonuclease VII large subunit